MLYHQGIMQKYDVQQLLRQQKDSVYQNIWTIVLAVLLGLSATEIFEFYKAELSTQIAFYIAVAIIVLLIITQVIRVLINRNSLIKVSKEKFTLLMIFDKENNSFQPIQIPDYDFSVDFQSNWNNVIGNNDEYIKSFKEANKLNTNPFGAYQNFFDYKVITDLIQYVILRKISDGLERVEQRKRYLNIRFPTINYWYYRIINKIILTLRKIHCIDRHFKKKSIFIKLKDFSEGTPLVFQAKQIQNNLFVKTQHDEQLKYEIEILRGNESPTSYSLLPFYMNFPRGVNLNLEKSHRSSLDKIVLKSKFGRLTIEFHDKWKYSSQKAFFFTIMKPGHQHHPYEEVIFEISIDLDIKRFAYFPVIGGSEDTVDEFFSWANQLIEDLKKFCDWNYNQDHITRDLFERLIIKLDWHDLEARTEYYGDFDDTDKGKIQRILRQTISPRFEVRKYAMEEIIKRKEEIPSDQLNSVILRILRLTHYEDSVTVFKAVESIGEFSTKIPNDLHKNVTDRLFELTNSKDNFIRGSSLKSLGLLYAHVGKDSKKSIQDKMIQIYVKTEPESFWIDNSSFESLKIIYPNIASIDRKKYEDYYLLALKSINDEIILALRFYFAIRDFVTKDRVKEVTQAAIKVEPSCLKSQTEYLAFFSTWSEIVPEILKHEYFEKLFYLLGHTNIEVKTGTSFYIRNSKQFIASLEDFERDTIYIILKKYINSNDKKLKEITLQSLVNLAGCFAGKEEEIGVILLDEIDLMEYPFEYSNLSFAYSVSFCLDTIKENIGNTFLLDRIDEFQNKLK